MALVTIAAAVLILAGCGGESSPVVTAAGPVHRPPAEVVSAFLAALDAADAPAALRLTTPRFRAQLESFVDSPLTNWVSVSDIRVGTPREDDAVGSAGRHRQILHVPVDFTLDQRREASMLDGPTTWGYVLVRDSPPDGWRIDDRGVG